MFSFLRPSVKPCSLLALIQQLDFYLSDSFEKKYLFNLPTILSFISHYGASGVFQIRNSQLYKSRVFFFFSLSPFFFFFHLCLNFLHIMCFFLCRLRLFSGRKDQDVIEITPSTVSHRSSAQKRKQNQVRLQFASIIDCESLRIERLDEWNSLPSFWI